MLEAEKNKRELIKSYRNSKPLTIFSGVFRSIHDTDNVY